MITQELLFGTNDAAKEQQQKSQEDKKPVEPTDKKETSYFNSEMFKSIVKQMREADLSGFIFTSLDFRALQ
jgi:hypothetical protein